MNQPAPPPAPRLTAIPGEDLLILRHDDDTTTTYRLVAPGMVIAGEARITTHGGWWHAEQDVDGKTIAVDAEDELGVVLALIAKRRGLAAVFGPDDGGVLDGRPSRLDAVASRGFNSVTHAAARTGRFLSLTDRIAIAEQVTADLRKAGVIS